MASGQADARTVFGLSGYDEYPVGEMLSARAPQHRARLERVRGGEDHVRQWQIGAEVNRRSSAGLSGTGADGGPMATKRNLEARGLGRFEGSHPTDELRRSERPLPVGLVRALMGFRWRT